MIDTQYTCGKEYTQLIDEVEEFMEGNLMGKKIDEPMLMSATTPVSATVHWPSSVVVTDNVDSCL